MFTKKAKKCIQPVSWAAMALYAALVMGALVLAAWPETAQAQTPAESRTTEAADGTPRGAGAAERVVLVEPGDSLWSISQKQLEPNATPRRVADAAERIHALNRVRIGADPNLIFVGQELFIPPALPELSPGATLARKTTHAAETGSGDRAAKGTTGRTPKPVPRTVAGGADAKDGKAPETVAQQKAQRKAELVGLPALPDVAAAAPVPAARAVTPDDAPIGGRRLLGLGVLVLTLLVAGLLAWRLPMKRATRGDAKRWGTLSGYYRYHGEAPPGPGTASFFYYPGSPKGPALGDRDERDARREAPRAPGLRWRTVFVGSGTASSPGTVRRADTAARRGRAPRAKAKAGAVPRNGLALGAHNPNVRRAPRRARATMRARRLRPRLRHGRGVSARGGR